MIRPIMPTDVFKLVDLAQVMHNEGRYKKFNFNKKKLTNDFLWHMANSTLIAFVEEKGGKIVGAIVGVIDTYFFGDDYLIVDKGLYVLPEHRKGKTGAKLLRAYIDAAKKLKVKEIVMGTSNMENPDALDPLYKKVGLLKVGSLYKMEV